MTFLLSQQCRSHIFFHRESSLLKNGEERGAQTEARHEAHNSNKESMLRSSALFFVFPRGRVKVLFLYNGSEKLAG